MSNLRKTLLKGTPPYSATRDVGDATSWSEYYDSQEILRSGFAVYQAGTLGAPVIFVLHGAGHSSQSWALVAKMLKDTCHIVAYDFRGHGATTVPQANMTLANVVADSVAVLNHVFPDGIPKLTVVGHSFGGAVAVHTASALPSGIVQALVVLDVVEGTALASIASTMNTLRSRPQKFDSVKSAIFWATSSATVRNRESARVSIPPQLVEDEDGIFRWKTNLEETSKYWKEWFTGMSAAFLAVPAPKLLCIAGTDRLDTALTVAQMQGKYQMAVMPSTGHSMQEDAPQHVTDTLVKFLQRFRIL
eukprot:TRINITY_DN3758_c0_g1_i1.p1 TRINITY_DN3758_c0_g1~~TRINITY_DN3758_c0_g1_i1.p1  ORF type:complete len:321 (-),score=34.33 TRINITY_DN3758_c0_g1_i1:127-1038(-)